MFQALEGRSRHLVGGVAGGGVVQHPLPVFARVGAHEAPGAQLLLHVASAVLDGLQALGLQELGGLGAPDCGALGLELAHALDHAGGHLSAYQLTIEPGTPFAARHARGEIRLPDEDTAAALYEATQDVMERAGRPAYEISNHARPGEECRHNLVYWQTDDYVGVGPGAHGRVTAPDGTKHATRAHRAPAVWLDPVDRDGHAVVERTPVARPERALELLLMGLRLTGGIDPARWRRESGRGLDESFDAGSIAALVEAGYLEFGPNRLAATAAGRQRLDAVIRALADAITA